MHWYLITSSKTVPHHFIFYYLFNVIYNLPYPATSRLRVGNNTSILLKNDSLFNSVHNSSFLSK